MSDSQHGQLIEVLLWARRDGQIDGQTFSDLMAAIANSRGCAASRGDAFFSSFQGV